MPAVPTTVFDLAAHPAKAAPELIADDERHFAAMTAALVRSQELLSGRLAQLRSAPARMGRQAVDRDLEIHETTQRLAMVRRHSLDLCLGRIVDQAGQPHYIGRIGLTDPDGEQLLIDWRAPAAEPFFAATRARPLGVRNRRRYRWGRGHIVDYWDEAFDSAADDTLFLDDDSAFIASLAASRSPRMRDVLGTIAADQDAIIRADSAGALVVDGGPGTGKTVVALHRAAYLLYSDPRLAGNRGGVLVIGPHESYLAYIADVLPGLGELSVATTTLRSLVPEGEKAAVEPDSAVAEHKSSIKMIDAVQAAVAWYEEPPRESFVVETEWGDVALTQSDWAEVCRAPDPGTAHNEARDEIWDALADIVHRRVTGGGGEDEVSVRTVRSSLMNDDELVSVVHRHWPMLEATDIVGDLWTVPAFLRMCAPWLSAEAVAGLQRSDAHAWTVADLPLLDAARRRLGDRRADARRRRAAAARIAQRAQMDLVIGDLLESRVHDDGEGLMSMLRQQDLREVLADDAMGGGERTSTDGPFAHIVVDEAQELTDAQWAMILSRCPSRSLTVVGDRAQARRGFGETWSQRLLRVGVDDVRVAELTVNYRTPEEIMAQAQTVIRAAIPDANVPVSIRRGGLPVTYGDRADLTAMIGRWQEANPDGIACVIGDPRIPDTPRVRSMSPATTKGLEFDLVVLVNPDDFGDGVTGAVDRYVAMTRATRQLTTLSGCEDGEETAGQK